MTAAEILEARKTNKHLTFSQWLEALDAAALTMGFKGRIVKDTGDDCWADYYNDGYTPRAALVEDLHSA
jgi:hypothetical protein